MIQFYVGKAEKLYSYSCHLSEGYIVHQSGISFGDIGLNQPRFRFLRIVNQKRLFIRVEQCYFGLDQSHCFIPSFIIQILKITVILSFIRRIYICSLFPFLVQSSQLLEFLKQSGRCLEYSFDLGGPWGPASSWLLRGHSQRYDVPELKLLAPACKTCTPAALSYPGPQIVLTSPFPPYLS